MSTTNLILAEVIRLPLPDPGEHSVRAQRLLQLANLWLQRRAAGHGDDLVLVGVGAASEEELRAFVRPYGLATAALEVVIIEDESIAEDLGEVVGECLDSYLRRKHPGAIPLAVWPKPFRDVGYPDDVWWLGLDCADAGAGEWSDSIKALAPPPFNAQAATWSAILEAIAGQDDSDDPSQQLAAGLAAASLARWLDGFNAASGNTFFSFDYGDAANECGLDPFMVGLEAGIHHKEEIEAEIDGRDAQDLLRLAVRELLASGRYFDTGALSDYFGSSATLFFSVYSSIWPRRDRAAGDACEELVSPSVDEMGEIDSPWRFVAYGDWGDIDDSL